VKELGLSDIKSEMRYLILDKTSLAVEEPPIVSYDRLKLAAEDEQRQSGESEKPAESKGHQSDQFVFSVVARQMKDMDYSAMRPPKPQGVNPHLSFVVNLINQDVEGDGGPYRQFF
jgi:other hect domain ubiquitin protein ligase E3